MKTNLIRKDQIFTSEWNYRQFPSWFAPPEQKLLVELGKLW